MANFEKYKKEIFLKRGGLFLVSLLLLSLSSCIFSRPFYGLSEEDFNFIKKETIGGELDFERHLDDNRAYVHNGKEYNSREMALLMWGQAVKNLGVKNRLDAIMIYEEITGEELTDEESRALKSGYDSK